MSAYFVGFDSDLIGPWVYSKIGQGQWPGGQAIGLWKERKLVAGLAFESYNGHNVFVHVCIEDRLATLLLFKLGLRYVFGQLELPRLTLWAEESNIAAIQLHKRLGAVLEGRLVGAGSSGDDILVSRLTPSCRLWRRWNGEEKQSAASA